MFYQAKPDGYREVLPGIQLKTLAFGERSLLSEFRLAAGSLLPAHAHPQEQTGYLVAGRLRLTIGGRTHDARPGGSWCIPGGVEHGADVLEDSVAVEVFSPVREDYLPDGIERPGADGQRSADRHAAG